MPHLAWLKKHMNIWHQHQVMGKYVFLVTQVIEERMRRQTFVPSNGLVLGALDSQSLGPGSMLGMDVCLSILSHSPEPPKTLKLMHVLLASY